MKDQTTLQIRLTCQQQQQIEQVLGKKVTVVELRPEALEARVAPGTSYQ